MMIVPKVHIVISNWKDYENLIECLKSIKKISYKNYHVDIIDTEPQEKWEQIIKETFNDNIHILKNYKDLGYAGNLNVGCKHALDEGAEYILTLDCDTVVTSNFLNSLVEVAEKNPHVGIVQSKIYLYHEPNKIDSSENRFGSWISLLIPEHKYFRNIKKNNYNETKSIYNATQTCSLIKRVIFEKVGFFDPIFFYGGDDFDFNFRVSKKEYARIYSPRSIIYHKHEAVYRNKGQYLPFHAYYLARCRLIFLRKHFGVLSYTIYLFYLILYQIPKSIIVYLFHFNSKKLALAYLRGITDGFKIKLSQIGEYV